VAVADYVVWMSHKADLLCKHLAFDAPNEAFWPEGLHCMQWYIVILKMCPFSGDEALQSNRKHAACTNGVRTKGRDFLTSEFSMILRKKGVFLGDSQNHPNIPQVNNLRSAFFTIRAFQSRP
jgi:hypothetical protein